MNPCMLPVFRICHSPPHSRADGPRSAAPFCSKPRSGRPSTFSDRLSEHPFSGGLSWGRGSCPRIFPGGAARFQSRVSGNGRLDEPAIARRGAAALTFRFRRSSLLTAKFGDHRLLLLFPYTRVEHCSWPAGARGAGNAWGLIGEAIVFHLATNRGQEWPEPGSISIRLAARRSRSTYSTEPPQGLGVSGVGGGSAAAARRRAVRASSEHPVLLRTKGSRSIRGCRWI